MGKSRKMYEKKVIVISLDCVGRERNIISGGIGTHVYEIYDHLDINFKKNILLLTGYGYDQPLDIDTIKLPFINMRYLKLISFHFIAAVYLLFFWRKLRPKAVHIHYLEVALLPVFVTKLMGAEAIITSHGYYNSKKFNLILRPVIALMWKILLPLIDVLIVLSDDARDFYYNLCKEYNLHNKIEICVIPNGAISLLLMKQLNEEEPLQKNNGKVILFVGRLAKEKNIISLLEAFGKINDNNLELWLVGDGPDKTKIENYAGTLQKYNKIKLLGWQPREQVYKLMKSAEVFVLPSRWEGMPIALLEAYALGMKCVCHRNTFTEKVPGVICLNSPDPNEISYKLQIALKTDIQNDQKFINQYTWENAAYLLAKLYKRCI